MKEFETIVLRAKEEVYRLLQGENFSKFLGKGYDFSELRAYESSDDIRHISWINSAKLGEPYVKKMYESRELLVHLCVVVDGRAVIGKKQAVMTHLLTLLAYSTLLSNNLLEISLSLGREFKSFEPTKEIEVTKENLKLFAKTEPLGLKGAYEQLEERLLKVQEQKSLLFLIGDFLEPIELSLLAQKHELYVIMVRDRWEETPKVASDVELLNPLSQKSIGKSLSKRALAHYAKKLQLHDQKLFDHFHQHNIRYIKVYDSSEAMEKLEQLFYF